MERVTVAELKSKLSHYLREVRAGKSFTVVSRDIPVATLGPHGALPDDGLASIPPDPSAPPLSAPVMGGPADVPDAVELIREGREDRSGPWAAPGDRRDDRARESDGGDDGDTAVHDAGRDAG